MQIWCCIISESFLQMKQPKKTIAKSENQTINIPMTSTSRLLLNSQENTLYETTSEKNIDIIKLMTKYVHAVKTEFRQFGRPLRGIGAIHFGYR